MGGHDERLSRTNGPMPLTRRSNDEDDRVEDPDVETPSFERLKRLASMRSLVVQRNRLRPSSSNA